MRANSSRGARPIVIVIGCDDVGSAVARRLHREGADVVIVDDADPPWPRRGMSYADAWYVGGATLEGIDACFCASVKSIPAVLARGDMIAATTWSWRGVAAAIGPVACFDLRDPPRAIAHPDGYRVDAPHAGRFLTRLEIAERVVAGEIVGELGAFAVIAPVSGVLRALSARGARVAAGQTLIEVDPSGDPARCFGIEPFAAEVARSIAASLRHRAIEAASAVALEQTATV